MSQTAKSARDAMKAKAKRLASADPHTKVDSSTWSPAEPLNADIKTGMRPLSRRAFKKGGKVIGSAEGEKAKHRSDRAPRASGGKIGKESSDRSKRYLTPDNLLNRDQKMANEAREGIKHVGGLKHGGKIKKFGGGDIVGDNPVSVQNRSMGKAAGVMKKGGRAKYATKGSVANPMTQDRTPTNIPAGKMVPASEIDQEYYDTGPKTEAQRMGAARSNRQKVQEEYFKTLNKPELYSKEGLNRAARSAIDASAKEKIAAQQAGYQYNPAKESMDYEGNVRQYKKGGKTKNWEGSKKDEAQDRMLAKKYGISMEKWEKSEKDKKHDKQQSMKGLKEGGRTAKYSGGGVFSGEGYPGKVPGATGGRSAHAKGGKAGKGKTNINIVIASGPPKGEGIMPNAPVPAPKAMPVPPPAAGMPMMPPPGMAPAGGPPVPPPGMMPRKNGGRTIHVIDHAAGGGLGRLEKIKAYGLKPPK